MEPHMSEELLNSNHSRRVSVTCQHIDRLLSESEAALDASSANRALPEYFSDVTPECGAVIREHIATVRSGLLRLIQDLGVEKPEAAIPVSRLLHTNLTFIEISAEELRPRYMRGYGELSSEAAAVLEKLSLELKELIVACDHCVASTRWTG
jgi:hypothetical protein